MLQLLLAIGLITVSIFIHELGHFLAARWRGLAVPRFSLFGIGKPIVSWKWRGVKYCICWLPFGAYVMVPQLSDMGDIEGETPEEVKNLPPADCLSKIIVAVAGPAANFLFALALGCIVWAVGVNVPAEFNRTEIGEVVQELQTTSGKTVPGPAAAAGLKSGDVIRSIDGKPVANFQDIFTGILLGANQSKDGRRMAELTLERDGQLLTRQVYPELTGPESLRTIGIAPRSDLIVDKVNPDSPAALAGLRPGDRILAVDGKHLSRRDELREHFQVKRSEPSNLMFARDGKETTISLQPRQQAVEGQTVYLIGVVWRIETVLTHPTPFTQITDAVTQSYRTLSSLLNRKSDVGVRHMSGIVGIVDNLQQVVTIGIIPAISFLVLINVSLAIFNLLPIPVLDGGHIMFALIAKLRGKPFSPAFLRSAVSACFMILIGLIVYVSYNDIRRAFRYRTNQEEASPPAKKVDPTPATPPATPAPATP